MLCVYSSISAIFANIECTKLLNIKRVSSEAHKNNRQSGSSNNSGQGKRRKLDEMYTIRGNTIYEGPQNTKKNLVPYNTLSLC